MITCNLRTRSWGEPLFDDVDWDILREIDRKSSDGEVYPEEGSDVEIQPTESTARVEIHTNRQPLTVTGRYAKCPQVQVEPPRDHQK